MYFLLFILIFFSLFFIPLWLSDLLDKRKLNKQIQQCIILYEDIVALQIEMDIPLYGENIFNVQIEQVKEGSMTIQYLKGYLQRYRALLFDKQTELQKENQTYEK
jgi:hypothetical protein